MTKKKKNTEIPKVGFIRMIKDHPSGTRKGRCFDLMPNDWKYMMVRDGYAIEIDEMPKECPFKEQIQAPGEVEITRDKKTGKVKKIKKVK